MADAPLPISSHDGHPPPPSATPPKWKRAWLAGLILSASSFLALLTIFVSARWSYSTPLLANVELQQFLLAVQLKAPVIIPCAFALAAAGLLCAITVIRVGSVPRGLILVLLTLPVFVMFFAGAAKDFREQAAMRQRLLEMLTTPRPP